jgi:hypothetical protein
MTRPFDNIVTYLESLRQRPWMYIGDITHLRSHLGGFQTGCAINGFLQDAAIYAAIVQAHGWHPPVSMHLCTYLIEHGYDPAFIVHEVVTIEIETWQHSYPDSGRTPLPEEAATG